MTRYEAMGRIFTLEEELDGINEQLESGTDKATAIDLVAVAVTLEAEIARLWEIMPSDHADVLERKKQAQSGSPSGDCSSG